jgi:hypothetical protein
MARTAFILRMVRYGGIAAALMGSAAGCATQCGACKKSCDGRFKSYCKDLDPGVNPQPLGTFTNGWIEAQHHKAEASDFVFYLDEWYLGGTRLGPAGLAHLRDVIKRLPGVPFPVVIQPHVDEALNETRRMRIVEALVNNGIADAERRVVVDIPQAEGMPGDEAERSYYQMVVPDHWGPLGRGGYGGGYGGGPFGRGFGLNGRAGWGAFGAIGGWGVLPAGIW